MCTSWGYRPCYGDPQDRKRMRAGGCGRGTLGESLGLLVVPLQRLLSVSQSHQGSCSQHPCLVHPPAQGFPEMPGFFNEVLGSPNQGPRWCTQALGRRKESPACRPQGCISVLGCRGGVCEGHREAHTLALSGEGIKGSRASDCQQRNSGTQLCLLLWAPPPSCVWGGSPAAFPPWRNRDTESQCSTKQAGGTCRATEALSSRGPSRWTRTPRLWARRCTWGEVQTVVGGARLGAGAEGGSAQGHQPGSWTSHRGLQSGELAGD